MSDIKIEYATNLVDKAVLSYLQNKIPVAGFSHYDIWLEDHAVAFTVAKMMSEDLLQDTQKALVRALQQGKSFHQFKKELKPYLMSKGWWGQQYMIDPKDGEKKLVQLGSTRRLKLIFETNIRTAQAKGQWERIWRNRDILPYLEYIESTSDSQREQHLEFVGLILPVEHPFWDKNFPPNGYNCKCSVLALTKKDAIAKKGEDGLKADLERANRLIEQEKEFENPRQQDRTVKHHRTVTPTFAYNAGKIDTVGLLDKIFQQKHGMDKWEQKLQQARERHLQKLVEFIFPENQLIRMANEIIDNDLVQALAFDPATETERKHEALVAVAVFRYFKKDGDTLRRTPKEEGKPNVNNSPMTDFEIVDKNGKVRQTIDLAFTIEPARYQKFNEHFQNTEERLMKQQKVVLNHLKKANIVPIDLRFMNTLNRATILQYLQTLTQQQQKQLIIILD